MMLIINLLLLSAVLVTGSEYTKILNRDRLLSRKKRYLNFPAGSNFGISMVISKALLQVQPRGWVLAIECDVPFPLPSDTRMLLNTKKLHYRQRREMFSQIEDALKSGGVPQASSCVSRLICEAQGYVSRVKTKSFIKDVLEAIFVDKDKQEEKTNCDGTVFQDCPLPLFKYVMGSFSK